jgi:small-conductance mechanosensitive channel
MEAAVLSCVLLVASLLWAGAAQAAAATDAASPTASASALERASVIVDGVALFDVRGVTAFPAGQRARVIRERIVAIAEDSSVAVDSLRVVEAGERSDILAGDRLIMGVVDADAELEAIARQTLAGVYRIRIGKAIETYRRDRSPEVLLTQTLHALGATLAAAGLILVLGWSQRKLDAAVTRRLGAHIEELPKETFEFLSPHQLWHALHGSFKAFRFFFTFVVLYVLLNYVLELYPWTRPAARGMFDLVMDPLRAMGAALVENLPDLIFLAILFLVVRFILKLVRLFSAGIEHGKIRFAGLDSEVAGPTYRIARFLIIIFALVVAYPYIPGSESDAFKGISLFLGLVFSLGSSSIISNLLAGYTMLYRRAFKVGDRIKVEEVTGDVMERRLLVTRLRSVKNEEVVIPNSLILNSNIINFSSLAKEQGLILHTTVGIGYAVPWRQVEAMLKLAASRTPGLMASPAPFVLQKGLGDFYVTYEINVYCDQPQAMGPTYTALHQNILDVFNEYGVQIMTPAYEGDTEEPKVVPKERWFEPPAVPPASPQATGG